VCLKSDMQNDINYQNRFTEKEKDEKSFCDDIFLHNTKRIYALRVSKNREFAFASFSTLKIYLFLKRATTNEKLLYNG
jgi:hypothetical protein